MDSATADEVFKILASEKIPLKKIGTLTDVAKMVAYLCDDAASYITGSEFVIDGGITL